MVYWAATYSEPFQTSKMEIFVKIVTSNEITLLRLNKGSEYASGECKVNCHVLLYIYIGVYFMLKSHVYFANSVQLDFHSKP